MNKALDTIMNQMKAKATTLQDDLFQIHINIDYSDEFYKEMAMDVKTLEVEQDLLEDKSYILSEMLNTKLEMISKFQKQEKALYDLEVRLHQFNKDKVSFH